MQASYNGIAVPANGQAIEYSNGKFTIPNHPIIPFIEGDGTGRDIWKALGAGGIAWIVVVQFLHLIWPLLRVWLHW